MDLQTTSHILLVKPNDFGFNPETGKDNLFQERVSADVRWEAQIEFSKMVATLTEAGIQVTLVNAPENCSSPDAVFPNNWLSFHRNRVVLYPMMAENRRTERNVQLVEKLAPNAQLIDLSDHETEGTFLEGTGSLVLDRVNRIAYASLSARTDENLVREFCKLMEFKPLIFRSHHNGDADDSPVYHTNVMLSIGTNLAICCFDCIPDKAERQLVRSALIESGKEILAISLEQMNAFAGNMLELKSVAGRSLLIMSESARKSLSRSQIKMIESYNQIIEVSIPTIETIGGGSARCMITEVFN